MTSTEAFSENVLEAMNARGISMTELASALGMSRPALSRVLNGHSGITIERASRIAEHIGVELPDLLRIPQQSHN